MDEIERLERELQQEVMATANVTLPEPELDDPMMEIPDVRVEAVPFVRQGDSSQPAIREEQPPPFFQPQEDSFKRLREASKSQLTAKLLGEATDILLSVMNPPLVGFFKERCQQLGAKPWQVVCAIVHRSCELREIDYYPETFGIRDMDETAARKMACRNCGQEIPNARWNQLYCCNRCGSYHQGSKIVPFGVHSDECPIKGQSWLRESGDGQQAAAA